MRDPHLTEYAKTNRRNMTEAEKRLWSELRAKRFLGLSFRRQKVVGSYIVDFASNDPKLIIEIDGESHAHQANYDTKRSNYLRSQGYRIMRFTNIDIIENLSGVLMQLEQELDPQNKANAPLPTLSPKGERAKA